LFLFLGKYLSSYINIYKLKEGRELGKIWENEGREMMLGKIGVFGIDCYGIGKSNK
jgi:hypothetical protein